MSQLHEKISEKLKHFIEQQKIYFVGTADDDGRVNVSPKGMDSLKVIGENRVIWLNVTGSGNETSAHVQRSSRMTIMFTPLTGAPLILRLYGNATVIHQYDKEWEKLYEFFEPLPGARQIFDLSVDLIQTSCGMSIPLYDYVEPRNLLNDWAEKIGREGVEVYWEEKNQLSIDGKVTNIIKK